MLAMVQDVSKDKEFNTIEFNEFLEMMIKQQQKEEEIKLEDMIEAVKYALFI